MIAVEIPSCSEQLDPELIDKLGGLTALRASLQANGPTPSLSLDGDALRSSSSTSGVLVKMVRKRVRSSPDQPLITTISARVVGTVQNSFRFLSPAGFVLPSLSQSETERTSIDAINSSTLSSGEFTTSEDCLKLLWPAFKLQNDSFRKFNYGITTKVICITYCSLLC